MEERRLLDLGPFFGLVVGGKEIGGRERERGSVGMAYSISDSIGGRGERQIDHDVKVRKMI